MMFAGGADKVGILCTGGWRCLPTTSHRYPSDLIKFMVTFQVTRTCCLICMSLTHTHSILHVYIYTCIYAQWSKSQNIGSSMPTPFLNMFLFFLSLEHCMYYDVQYFCHYISRSRHRETPPASSWMDGPGAVHALHSRLHSVGNRPDLPLGIYFPTHDYCWICVPSYCDCDNHHVVICSYVHIHQPIALLPPCACSFIIHEQCAPGNIHVSRSYYASRWVGQGSDQMMAYKMISTCPAIMYHHHLQADITGDMMEAKSYQQHPVMMM